MIRTLAIENYRSLRRVVMPLASLNVVTGANGSGKSSLYRALRLLADSARNGAVAALSHSRALVDALGRAARNGGAEVNAIELAKEFGETGVVGQEALDQPAWHWPKRLPGSRRVGLAGPAALVRGDRVREGQSAEEQPAGYEGRGGR